MMCDYCHEENSLENLSGLDGVLFDKEEGKHFLYIEHFRNEKYKIEVNYCPECGRKLQVI
jgi:hypothetical protein